VKITILNEKIDNVALITVKQKKVQIVGTLDMDRDGFIDIIFTDKMGSVINISNVIKLRFIAY